MSIEVVPGEYREIVVSWPSLGPQDLKTIKNFRTTLLNLTEIDEKTLQNCYQGSASTKKELVYESSKEINSITIKDLIPDAFFSVRVDAIYFNGVERNVGVLSSSPRVTSSPPQTFPKDIQVKNLNDTAVLVTWNPPDDVNCTGELMSYNAVTTTQLMPIDKREIHPSENEFILSPLIPGTSYSIKMSAQTRAGFGPYSKSFNFKTSGFRKPTENFDDTFPGYSQEKLFLCHPLRVSIQEINQNYDSVQINWDLKDYRVQSTKANEIYQMELRPKECTRFPDSEILVKWDRTDNLSLKNTRAIDSNDKNFTISQLKPNTEYYVRISSMLNGEETFPYLTIVNTNPAEKGHFSLTYPKVEEVMSDSATIHWLPNNKQSLKGYLVKFYLANPDDDSIGSGVTIKNVLNPEQTSLNLKNLTPSKVYKFSVCQVPRENDFNSPIGEHLCTRTQTFETPGTKPLATVKKISIYPYEDDVSLLNDALIDGRSIKSTCPISREISSPIRVVWQGDENKMPNTFSYEIFLSGDDSLSQDNWYREIVSRQYNSILLRNLKPDCVYYLRLAMVNLYGNGPTSQWHSFKTPNEFGIGGGILAIDHEPDSFYRLENSVRIHPWNSTNEFSYPMPSAPYKNNIGGNVGETSSDDFKWLIVGCISGLVLLMIIVVSLVHIIKYVIKSKSIQIALNRDLKGISTNGNFNSNNMVNSPNSIDYLSCNVQKPQSINTSGFHSCSLLNNVENQSQVLNSTGRSSEISFHPNNPSQCRNFMESDSNNQYRVTPVESESSFGFNNHHQNSTRRSNFKPFFNDCKQMSPQINLLHDCDANNHNRSSLSAGLNSLDMDSIGQTFHSHHSHQPSPKNMQIMSNSLFYQNQYQQKNSLRRKNSEDQIIPGSSVSPTSSFNGIYREQFGSFGRISNDENRTQSPNQFSNAQSPITPGSRKVINNHRNFSKPTVPSILTSKTYSCNMNENLTMSDTKMSSFKPYVTPSTPRVNATHLHSPAESKSSIGYDPNQMVNCTSSSGMGESPAPGELSTTPQISSNSSAVDEPNSRKLFQTKLVDQKNINTRLAMNNGNFNLNQPGLQKGFSTEELSMEMANLEGLMKDLSEITNKEFKC